MKRFFIPLIGMLLLTVVTVWWLGFLPQEDASTAVYQHAKTLQYNFTVQNRSNALLPQAELKVYAPVRQTSVQRLVGLEASHHYELLDDELGNRVLRFSLEDLAPHESRVVRIRANVETTDTPHEFVLMEPERFLSEERFVELGAPALQRVAESLQGESPLDLARAAYDWAARNIRGEDYISDDRGALWAITNHRGDCTEYMYTVMALARSHGIPARGVGGYVMETSGVLRPAAYHNWAELYLDGAWRVIDAQRGRFMAEEENYVAMRILSEENSALLRSSHRFAYSGNGLYVAMD